MKNRQILLKNRPKGIPQDGDFEIRKTDVSGPAEGELLIKVLYLSVDPYMRNRMRNAKSYVRAYELNDVAGGESVGKVIKSRSSRIAEGSYVLAATGWQEYAVVSDDEVRKIDEKLAPVSTALGVLGMPGLTAYFGMLEIGKPRKNEVVAISGAAGAVGSIAGQIAKIKEAYVIGIAGSNKKTEYLKQELGFDEAINYKESSYLRRDLKKASKDGIDVYFDNVGGKVSDAAMSLINLYARIVVCGQIALYNEEKAEFGPRLQPLMIINRAMMKGFIVYDYREWFNEALSQLATWVNQGELKYQETVYRGFDKVLPAFRGLFEGENIGKFLVKLED